MIYPSWQDQEVALLQLDPNPLVFLASDIEVAFTVKNVPDFLVFVQVLIEEHFHFALVDIAHLLFRDCDLVSMFVVAL